MRLALLGDGGACARRSGSTRACALSVLRLLGSPRPAKRRRFSPRPRLQLSASALWQPQLALEVSGAAGAGTQLLLSAPAPVQALGLRAFEASAVLAAVPANASLTLRVALSSAGCPARAGAVLESAVFGWASAAGAALPSDGAWLAATVWSAPPAAARWTLPLLAAPCTGQALAEAASLSARPPPPVSVLFVRFGATPNATRHTAAGSAALVAATWAHDGGEPLDGALWPLDVGAPAQQLAVAAALLPGENESAPAGAAASIIALSPGFASGLLTTSWQCAGLALAPGVAAAALNPAVCNLTVTASADDSHAGDVVPLCVLPAALVSAPAPLVPLG